MRRLRRSLAWLGENAPKVARLSAFVLVVLVVLSGVLMRRAVAQVSDALMALGPEMLALAADARIDEPRTLELNGAQLEFASGSAGVPMGDVLDYYERRCAERSGGLAEQLRAAREQGFGDGDPETGVLDPVLREDSGERGFVACLDMGSGEMTMRELARRVEVFERSMDLADLGDLRYVYAEKTARGTHFVVFWTEGSFPVGRLFPAEGDAPGQDVAGVPRPPDARRLLSTRERGAPASVVMYTGSSLDLGALTAFYRRRLAEAGWELVEKADTKGRPRPKGDTVIAERDGRGLTVVVGEDDDGRGRVTIMVTR